MVSTFYWLGDVEVLERVTRTKRSPVYQTINKGDLESNLSKKDYEL